MLLSKLLLKVFVKGPRRFQPYRGIFFEHGAVSWPSFLAIRWGTKTKLNPISNSDFIKFPVLSFVPFFYYYFPFPRACSSFLVVFNNPPLSTTWTMRPAETEHENWILSKQNYDPHNIFPFSSPCLKRQIPTFAAC